MHFFLLTIIPYGITMSKIAFAAEPRVYFIEKD